MLTAIKLNVFYSGPDNELKKKLTFDGQRSKIAITTDENVLAKFAKIPNYFKDAGEYNNLDYIVVYIFSTTGRHSNNKTC